MPVRRSPKAIAPIAASITKSPVNAAVAALIKAMRGKAGQDTQTVAHAFHLSAAYVRAIEAGRRALPPYAVVGLIEQFGMTWAAATDVVAIANFMDLGRVENQYDTERLKLLAQRLRTARPELRAFLDGVVEVIDAKAPPESLEWAQRTVRLGELLDRCVNEKAIDDRKDALATPTMLSPVFEDLAELLMDRLALFPPHVNTVAIQGWERKNNHRIRSLQGYVSDADTLTASSKDFDWTFLRNGLSPTIRVLVSTESPTEVRDIEGRFRENLAKFGLVGAEHQKRLKAPFEEAVEIRSAGEQLRRDISKALRFDFAGGSGAEPGPEPSSSTKNFPNAWLYELQPESRDGRPRWVGFLMDKEPTGYAVAMNREHVSKWLNIFRNVWTQNSQKRARARSLRGARN